MFRSSIGLTLCLAALTSPCLAQSSRTQVVAAPVADFVGIAAVKSYCETTADFYQAAPGPFDEAWEVSTTLEAACTAFNDPYTLAQERLVYGSTVLTPQQLFRTEDDFFAAAQMVDDIEKQPGMVIEIENESKVDLEPKIDVLDDKGKSIKTYPAKVNAGKRTVIAIPYNTLKDDVKVGVIIDPKDLTKNDLALVVDLRPYKAKVQASPKAPVEEFFAMKWKLMDQAVAKKLDPKDYKVLTADDLKK